MNTQIDLGKSFDKLKEPLIKPDYVAETLTKMYDLGLEHAINLVKDKRSHYPTSHELHYYLTDLIEQLTDLKEHQSL